jgi:hypothetical protein
VTARPPAADVAALGVRPKKRESVDDHVDVGTPAGQESPATEIIVRREDSRE